MGDSGDPCGVPFSIRNGGEIYDSILIDASLPVRKESVQSHTLEGKPLLRKIAATRSGLMLSKKPKISNKRRAPAWPVAKVPWILWTRHATASIALCWGHDPNCDIGRSHVVVCRG